MKLINYFLFAAWPLCFGCGVKGDPLPPLAPTSAPQTATQTNETTQASETVAPVINTKKKLPNSQKKVQ